VLGGLSKLNIYYHGYVQKVYGGVLNIHIAAFALTSLNLLGFLVFILRPFMAKVGGLRLLYISHILPIARGMQAIAMECSARIPILKLSGPAVHGPRPAMRPGASLSSSPSCHLK
jgi:hypothetical protein